MAHPSPLAVTTLLTRALPPTRFRPERLPRPPPRGRGRIRSWQPPVPNPTGIPLGFGLDAAKTSPPAQRHRGDERVGPRRHRPGRARIHRVRQGRDWRVRFHRRPRLAGLPPGRAGRPSRRRVCLGGRRRGRPSQRTRLGGACRRRTIEGHLFFYLGDDSSFRAKPFARADEPEGK